MNLKRKMILLGLPPLIGILSSLGLFSATLARAATTRMATRLLVHKAEQLRNYAASQWEMVVRHDFVANPAYVEAARGSIAVFARSLARSPTELVFATDRDGRLVMASSSVEAAAEETRRLAELAAAGREGWVAVRLAGSRRVGETFPFQPFGWQFYLMEQEASFYKETRAIMLGSLAMLFAASAVAVALLLVLADHVVRPVRSVVESMRHVVSERDFEHRVEIGAGDEIGLLAREFNAMTANLGIAYRQLRDTALAEARSRRAVADRELETLAILAQVADHHDQTTAAHAVRVSLYSALLDRLVGDSPERQDLIRHAAPLHDLGKIAIADSILLKPSPLTDEEFEIIKKHTTAGYDILRSSTSQYLRAGAEIALTHHERWDGSGYPRGLVGLDIPLFGRIVGLVDVFDALTCRRPYKGAWPFEAAVAEVASYRGTLFDPTLIDLFLGALDDVRAIFQEHSDA